MNKQTAFMLFFASIFSGCAGMESRQITSVETEFSTVTYRDGISCSISALHGKEEGKFFSASVCGAPIDSRTASLKITMLNKMGFPVTVIDREITAESEGARLKINTYTDMLKKERSRQAWASFGTALAAAGNSYSASQSGYSTTSGTVSGTYGGTRVNGYYSGTTYDANAAQAAQQRANAQNADNIRNANAVAAVNESALNASAFKSQTIDDGDFYEGMLELELPKKNPDASPRLIKVTIRPGSSNEMTFAMKVD